LKTAQYTYYCPAANIERIYPERTVFGQIKKMWQLILTFFYDSFHPLSPEKSDGGRCGDPNLVLSL
jgi:hypothetical protein